MVVKVVPQSRPEPLIDRHAEADLPALENLGGEHRPDRVTQDRFPPLAPSRMESGKGRNRLGKVRIHERHPALQPCRHHHAVATLEQVVGQPRGLIEEEGAFQCGSPAPKTGTGRADAWLAGAARKLSASSGDMAPNQTAMREPDRAAPGLA